MGDTQNSPILFQENSYESMRITAEGHRWHLCEHGWKYCFDCDGWPCGEPRKVNMYCEECAADSPFQIKPTQGVSTKVIAVVGVLIGILTGYLIALFM